MALSARTANQKKSLGHLLKSSCRVKFLNWSPIIEHIFQYQNYLEFIRSICLLNFQTEWDAMRIPSTKRICFVGNYDSNSNLDKIDALLAEKEKFKPRDIKGSGLSN